MSPDTKRTESLDPPGSRTPDAEPAPSAPETKPDQDIMQTLIELFEISTKSTETLKEAHRRLEERVRDLDQELQEKNRELALTSEHLSSILDSMSDGVVAVDTEGVITTFNQAASKILGHKPGAVLGQSFRQIFGQEFSELPGHRLREIQGHDGKMVPVSERVSPICDSSDTPRGSVKVFQDLSEIEALREQVRRKDRLAALGEMAATVAHEIRNPLGGIRGFAALLQRDIPEDDPRARLVAKILQGTKALDHVVNELLEYTRPVELELRSAGCRDLVQEALGYLHVAEGTIDLRNDVDEDLKVFVDPNRAKQVLMNILLNAVQSIEHEGVIAIGSETHESTVTLTVSDTGCGIPEDQLEHLFSPFYTTKEKGTGLGLAVAAKIVDGHGGSLTVKSEVGKGTAFAIRLPRAD